MDLVEGKNVVFIFLKNSEIFFARICSIVAKLSIFYLKRIFASQFLTNCIHVRSVLMPENIWDDTRFPGIIGPKTEIPEHPD